MPYVREINDHSDFFGGFAKVYTLSDCDGNVFYVGCTISSLENRTSGHISEARRNRKTSNWRKNKRIIDLNFNIVATVIEMRWVTGTKAVYALKKIHPIEKKWIKNYIDLGYDLCNRVANRNINSIINSTPDFIGKSISINNGKIISKAEITV